MEKDKTSGSKREAQFLITEAAICCPMVRVKSTRPYQPKEVAHVRSKEPSKQRKEVSSPDLKLMNSDVDRKGLCT